MRELAADLWVAETPLRFLGLEMGARMTVMRLPGSRLLVHSPVRADQEVVAAVRALGRVAFIVAPNRLHHLFVAQWQQAFPDAAVYAAPGVERKRPDLQLTGLLRDAAEPGWADSVDQVMVHGIPATNEVVFFHRPSATLVASDLAFNIGPGSPALTRFAFRLGGTYGRLCPSAFERLLVRDRSAFRASLDRVFAWPFERVVVAHGAIAEGNAREELSRGYAWALRDGSVRKPAD